MKPSIRAVNGSVLVLLLAATAQAQLPPIEVTAPRVTPQPPPEPPQPPPIVVRPLSPAEQPGRSAPIGNLPGGPASASQGVISQADLDNVPILRTTDFLEQIPGLVVTQHSS